MNRALALLFLAIVLRSHAIAEVPNKPRWEDLSRLLGHLDSSRELADLRGSDKPQRVERGANEYQLFFDERGYSLAFREGRLTKIFLQLVPGKKIRERAYVGTLPLDIRTIWVTPDEARRTFGPPTSDVSHGFREISYERAGHLITLYFSDQHIESIAIAIK